MICRACPSTRWSAQPKVFVKLHRPPSPTCSDSRTSFFLHKWLTSLPVVTPRTSRLFSVSSAVWSTSIMGVHFFLLSQSESACRAEFGRAIFDFSFNVFWVVWPFCSYEVTKKLIWALLCFWRWDPTCLKIRFDITIHCFPRNLWNERITVVWIRMVRFSSLDHSWPLENFLRNFLRHSLPFSLLYRFSFVQRHCFLRLFFPCFLFTLSISPFSW